MALLRLPEELLQMIINQFLDTQDSESLHSLYQTSRILQKSVTLYLTSDNPQAGIMFSAQTGKAAVLLNIINKYSFKDRLWYYPEHALVTAAKSGHATVVKMLLQNFDGHPVEALMAAVKRGHASVVSILLKYSPFERYAYLVPYCVAVERSNGDIMNIFHQHGWHPKPEAVQQCLQERRKERYRIRLLKKYHKQPNQPFSRKEKRHLSDRKFWLG